MNFEKNKREKLIAPSIFALGTVAAFTFSNISNTPTSQPGDNIPETNHQLLLGSHVNPKDIVVPETECGSKKSADECEKNCCLERNILFRCTKRGYLAWARDYDFTVCTECPN